jgi:hypothetical protein
MGIRSRFRSRKRSTAKAEPDKGSMHPDDTPLPQVAAPSPTSPKRKSIALNEIEKYEKEVRSNARDFLHNLGTVETPSISHGAPQAPLENPAVHPKPVREGESPKPPSTAKTIFTFIRRFAVVGGGFLLGASWTMLQIDEYGIAFLLLVLGTAALSIQMYDWKGIEAHSQATKVLKIGAYALIAFSLLYFSAVIVKKKQGKPWSTLLVDSPRSAVPGPSSQPATSAPTVAENSSITAGPTSKENELEGNVFLSEEYPAIGKAKTFTFFGIKNYGVVTIQARFGLSDHFTMILLVHSTEPEPGIPTMDCLTAINNYQAIVDDLKTEAKKGSPEFIDFAITPNLVCHYDYKKDITPEASETLKRIALRKNLILSIEGPRGPK